MEGRKQGQKKSKEQSKSVNSIIEQYSQQLLMYPIMPVSYEAPSVGKHTGITDALNVIGSCSFSKAMSLLKFMRLGLLYSG